MIDVTKGGVDICVPLDEPENALQWCFNGVGNPPPPQTGCYLEEVLSDGPPRPAWNF